MKVRTEDFETAIGCFKTDVIADVTEKHSSIHPVHWADGQHSVALLKAESASGSNRFSIFHPLSALKAVGITG